MTHLEAREAIKKATAEAILGLPDELRAVAVTEGPLRFEIHITNAMTVDAVERTPRKANQRRSKKR